jgi:subtilisin family serine protease
LAGQGYLNAAPQGIDARWAWTQTNGAGAGIGFVDIEQGWFLAFDAASATQQHEDLPSINDRLRVSPGVPRTQSFADCPQSRHHGTAVVGVVAGVDNTTGIVGAAPNLRSVEVASHINGGQAGDIENAIDKVLGFMAAGDVLLIEWQEALGPILNLPAEVKDRTFRAISRAIAKDVIVIEPAGNFSVNLDTIASLNPALPQFRDSGAIIVGACNKPNEMGDGRTRWVAQESDIPPANSLPPFLPNCFPPIPVPSGFVFPGSNFGERVDCYAWGEGIVSAGFGWLGGTTETNSYTDRFAGTSGAAAIVAGAVALIQGLHKHVKGKHLTPAEMRTALKRNGTAQQQSGGMMEKIGVMPDVRRVAEALGLAVASSPNGPTNLRVIDQ